MKLKRFNSIDKKSVKSALKVLKSGKLSPFVGNWKNDKIVGSFYGGKNVQDLENYFKKKFNVKYAIAVNSWTSGLICAVGAIDIKPGDEIIVSTWTMCASATAIIHWMAIPVFADIDKDTFNINLETIKKCYSKRTKAIIVPDIMGQSSEIDKIMSFANKKKLIVISDSAQAIGVKYKNKYAGTVAHVGGYSFNYHKPINCGEDGIIVTNIKKIAQKMYLIRNHGEAVVQKMGFKDINNIVGYNFRMGEIEAAIALSQMKQLNSIIRYRKKLASILNKELKNLPYLQIPKKQTGSDHLYYYYALKFKNKNFPKSKIIEELNKRKIPVEINYANIHMLPMFKKKIAYGKYPWKFNMHKVKYGKGACPIAENINTNEYIGLHMYKYDYTADHMYKICNEFKKVWKKFFDYK